MKQYQMAELAFQGRDNPENAVDVELSATFSSEDEVVTVKGFYAGAGVYKVRFLPMQSGTYHYIVHGVIHKEGDIQVETAEANMHGIPHAENLQVKYSDGTGLISFGTTVYALAHQSEQLIEETFATLEKASFNKIRMCVFPKHYQYNHNEPIYYPFSFLPGKTIETVARDNGPLSMISEPLWDVKKPNFDFWDHLEGIIKRLDQMGIIVDLILFHPYDRWGFSKLTRDEGLTYLDYTIRRLSAFPNLMWSLANEFDLMPGKTMEDWYTFEEYVAAQDSYHHMLSNHNCFVLYDYSRPNITHISIQTRDPSRVCSLMKYGKPVFIDECAYEGNLEETFGSLTGQEMNDRFWKVTVCGGFCTHGETFVDYDASDPDEQAVFWAKGGRLKGDSPKRIAYLREFIESLPGSVEPSVGSGFAPMLYMTQKELQELATVLPDVHATVVSAVSRMGEEERLFHLTTESEYNGHVGEEVYIRYFGRDVHGRVQMDLPSEKTYRIEVVDTWNMTRETVASGQSGSCKVRVPEKQWMAVVAILEDLNMG